MNLNDVSRLQKRARDKEYRLRKSGANRESIATVSPRKSWSEVKSMTPQQLNRYGRSLNNFNKNARYTGTKSGDVIPTKMVKQIKELVEQRNQFIRKERARIEAASPQDWLNFKRRQRGILAHDKEGMGLLTPVDPKKLEKPKSLNAAKRRIKSLQTQRKHDYGYYRRIQRKNMVRQLNRMGYAYLAHVVQYMPNDKFDVLSTITPVWHEMDEPYADALAGHYSETNEKIEQYILFASSLGTKQGGKHEELSNEWKVAVLKHHEKREKAFLQKLADKAAQGSKPSGLQATNQRAAGLVAVKNAMRKESREDFPHYPLVSVRNPNIWTE